jgi:hypothetical protein
MNKTNINIDKRPYGQTTYHSGTYVIGGILWEDEYQPDEVFPFTVEIHHDLDNSLFEVGKIEWQDGIKPANYETIQETIVNNLYNQQKTVL